jgi:hypothetical protein
LNSLRNRHFIIEEPGAIGRVFASGTQLMPGSAETFRRILA